MVANNDSRCGTNDIHSNFVKNVREDAIPTPRFSVIH